MEEEELRALAGTVGICQVLLRMTEADYSGIVLSLFSESPVHNRTIVTSTV